MASDDIVIGAEGLGKCYRIFRRRRERVHQAVGGALARMLRRPAPMRYEPFWALRDVSFTVRRGETVGVVGRNGSGKSTLLQLLCGTLNNTEGRYHTHGRVAALLELGSGFNPEFTGRENVHVNAALMGLAHRDIEARMDRIVDFAGIGDFLDMPTKTYSSGMLVRLAFSVIAHLDADILVIDEALAVGDAQFVQRCMRFLREFQKRGTIFFVSHDTGAVAGLCDRVLLLNEGRLLVDGPPVDVLKQYMVMLHAEQQAVDGLAADAPPPDASDAGTPPESETPSGAWPREAPPEADPWYDLRDEYARDSSLRDDAHIVQFSPYGPRARDFGTGEARIESVRLMDARRHPLTWVVGGRDTILCIRGRASVDMAQVAAAFHFKDRLGQTLFADNTVYAYQYQPVAVRAGGTVEAEFTFRMPHLPAGKYAIDAVLSHVVDGAEVHTHWAHDALVLEIAESLVFAGLMGAPTRAIRLEAGNGDGAPPAP